MMKPTAGFITYQNRIDVLKCMQEFRQCLGLCPQENRLFPYLSAFNHLIFFGMVSFEDSITISTYLKSYFYLLKYNLFWEKGCWYYIIQYEISSTYYFCVYY